MKRENDTKTWSPVEYNSKSLARDQHQYVCWLDLMGAQSAMRRSLRQAAHAVMKIHVACQEELQGKAIALHPVVDGVYIRSARRAPLEKILRRVMGRLAETFLQEERKPQRYLYRGALAFGPVASGAELASGSDVFGGREDYVEHIVIGMPLSQAYGDERNAPPFGIYVNESARAFSPNRDAPFPSVWWRWWRSGDDIRQRLLDGLTQHYSWARAHPVTLGYEIERMNAHWALATEYFDPHGSVA